MSKDKNCADEQDGMDMTPGQYVTANRGKYTIMELLGKGGFGAVYKVQLNDEKKFYALKAEKKLAKRDHSKLTMEMYILKTMSKYPEEKSHFTRIYDKSKKTKFYLIVMTLVGESLSELKKRHLPPIFTPNTGYAVSYQCLEAVEELHKIGFIHRDIKPGNFAVGLETKNRIVYILDFGIARRVVNDSGELKAPRIRVPFKGTVRFAPLASHENKELSYKDDCESWFYMIADMCNPKGLPWKMEKNKDAVAAQKRHARTPEGKERLFYMMAVEEFSKGFDYIVKLQYINNVKYEFLYAMLRQAGERMDCTLEPPYDWEGGTMSSSNDGTLSTDSTPGGGKTKKSAEHSSVFQQQSSTATSMRKRKESPQAS